MANFKRTDKHYDELTMEEQKLIRLYAFVKTNPRHKFVSQIEQYMYALQPNLLKINPEKLKKSFKEYYPQDYNTILGIIEGS